MNLGNFSDVDLGFFLIAVGLWLAAAALLYATPAFVRRYGLPHGTDPGTS